MILKRGVVEVNRHLRSYLTSIQNLIAFRIWLSGYFECLLVARCGTGGSALVFSFRSYDKG